MKEWKDQIQALFYPIYLILFEFSKMISIDGINRPTNSPALRSYDQDLQLDLAYYIHQIKGSTFIIESRLEILNAKAKIRWPF